ncbi:hypothetical protein B0H13DRAFT_2416511 [Mycena leptocephala]|nr:hypothetical protein B0H13DRAFT_2416511 [Mycena leptocephala]
MARKNCRRLANDIPGTLYDTTCYLPRAESKRYYEIRKCMKCYLTRVESERYYAAQQIQVSSIESQNNKLTIFQLQTVLTRVSRLMPGPREPRQGRARHIAFPGRSRYNTVRAEVVIGRNGAGSDMEHWPSYNHAQGRSGDDRSLQRLRPTSLPPQRVVMQTSASGACEDAARAKEAHTGSRLSLGLNADSLEAAQCTSFAGALPSGNAIAR